MTTRRKDKGLAGNGGQFAEERRGVNQVVLDDGQEAYVRQVCRTMREQIGNGNIMAISGGRVFLVTAAAEPTIEMPAGDGYQVQVVYNAAADSYTVRRLFRRGGKDTVHGERDGIFFDELGETAYRASCYRSYGDEEW